MNEITFNDFQRETKKQQSDESDRIQMNTLYNISLISGKLQAEAEAVFKGEKEKGENYEDGFSDGIGFILLRLAALANSFGFELNDIVHAEIKKIRAEENEQG